MRVHGYDATAKGKQNNQVITSASYLQQMLASANRDDFLEKYYATIESKYKNGIKIPIDKTKFKEYFQGSHKIHYLIGYLKGFGEDSRSTYAKYLTVEVIKKLLAKGFDCTPLLIGK